MSTSPRQTADFEYANFLPPAWLRGPHAQSVLSSAAPRQWLVQRRAEGYLAAAEPLLIDCGDGVRLSGFFNAGADPANERLVIMLHGWEGSSQSVYNLALGPQLQQAGYDTLRLNLRDHGDSHHLNEEMFHSCRLPEVVGAVAAITRRFPERRVSMVGYSLGGNFALRVAREAGRAGFELEQVVAICPVLDPRQTMQALVTGPGIYQQYFIRKWRRSLEKKRAAFPHLYQFDNLTHFDDIGAMTDYFVTRYTEYADLQTYLQGYAITEGRLHGLTVPATAILADDDPVIPVAGLRSLDRPAALRVVRTRYGGHCGFLNGWLERSWSDAFVLGELGRPR
ncbi:MAG: alpha/beta fold hydrolase [Gammaproteobacteria bacterium]|jgi:predicted alpha/beta-fold hydrolase|nr:alpha/beta fold hydrolase [Gammaproteobacteria bacterium]